MNPDLAAVKIFEFLFIPLLILLLSLHGLVEDPPLHWVDGLELPQCPEDPDKLEGSEGQPDPTDDVETLPSGDTLAPRPLALLHHGGTLAGVVTLGPGRYQASLLLLLLTFPSIWNIFTLESLESLESW